MAFRDACCRWSFVAYDLFLGLVSAAVTVFAAYILIEVLSYGYFLDVRVVAAPSIALLLGALILLPIIVLLGFRAFTTKRTTLAIVYWVLMAFGFLLSVALGVWTLILRKRVMAGLMAEKIISSTLKSDPKSLTDPSTKHFWDALQTSMQCCGLNGAADYKSSGALPMSCCDVVEHVCSKTFARGCEAALTDFAAIKLAEITIVAFAVALFLLIGVYTGCSFTGSLKKKNRRTNEIITDLMLPEQMPLNGVSKSVPLSRMRALPPSPPRKPPPPVPLKPVNMSRQSSRQSSVGGESTVMYKLDPSVLSA